MCRERSEDQGGRKAAGGVRHGPAQVEVGVEGVGRALGERGSWEFPVDFPQLM